MTETGPNSFEKIAACAMVSSEVKMTATLPVDRETEHLARELARITGKPLQTVVREALEMTAAAVGVVALAKRRLDMSKIREILARVDSLPVLDTGSANEIIGYDELGLPG